MSDKKALLVADIHHGVTIGKLGASGLDLRLEDTLFLEEHITQFCVDEGIPLVIFLGDRFLTRNPPMWLVNKVDELWKRRIDLGIKCIALVGNHDCYRVVDYGTSYSALWKGSGLSIVDKPRSVMLFDRKVGYLPFGYKLEELPGNDYDILFFHDEVQGFEDKRGFKARTGAFAKGLNLQELEHKAKLVIGGHIHSHEDFGTNCCYLGAPYQIDRLDIGKERGITLLDFEDLSMEFIPIDAPRLVELTVTDINETIGPVAIHGNYVKCFVKAGGEKTVEHVLTEAGARSLVVHTIREKGLMVESVAKRIYSAKNPNAMIKEFVNSRQLADKDLLIDAGMKLWGALGE